MLAQQLNILKLSQEEKKRYLTGLRSLRRETGWRVGEGPQLYL